MVKHRDRRTFDVSGITHKTLGGDVQGVRSMKVCGVIVMEGYGVACGSDTAVARVSLARS